MNSLCQKYIENIYSIMNFNKQNLRIVFIDCAEIVIKFNEVKHLHFP